MTTAMIAPAVFESVHYEVPTSAIFLPEAYQRTETRNELFIRKLVKAFDWRLFGELKLSDRDDGTYACIDGGHRLETAVRLEIPHVPAEVMMDLSVAEEAELCLALNRDRRGFVAYDKWKIELMLGYPDVTALSELIKYYAVSIVPGSAGRRGPRQIRAVSALRLAYRMTDEQALGKALETLVGTWDGRYLTGDLIKVLALFYHRHPNTMASEVCAALQKQSPERLEMAIREARKVTGGAGGERRAVELIARLHRNGRNDR